MINFSVFASLFPIKKSIVRSVRNCAFPQLNGNSWVIRVRALVFSLNGQFVNPIQQSNTSIYTWLFMPRFEDTFAVYKDAASGKEHTNDE